MAAELMPRFSGTTGGPTFVETPPKPSPLLGDGYPTGRSETTPQPLLTPRRWGVRVRGDNTDMAMQAEWSIIDRE